MNSINSLTGNQGISFDSLQNVSSGTYNVGEIVAKTGRSGITFDKVNNHVTRTGCNGVVRSTDQNAQTNAAVFKAILATYGADMPQNAIDRVLDADLDSIADDVFNGFSNPYVKEAFHFLLTGDLKGKPLSRDEMRLLIRLLDDGRAGSGVQTQAGMQRLRNLHALKTCGLVDDGNQGALADVKGFNVRNARVRAKNALDVTKNQWAAGTGMIPREKATWKTGVPMLEQGVVLKQSASMNTCFLCSVLNGIARSEKLRAHFASLVDRRKDPPTISLYLEKGRRTYSLDETFGLDDKTLKKIAKLKTTEFERFFMRYLSAFDNGDDYRPGDYGNDMNVTRALGLVPTSQLQKPNDDAAWGRLVDHLQNGGLVTLNRVSAFSRHYTSVVSADANGCRIADSNSGTISYLTKAQALKLWDASVTLSFFTLPSQDKVDRFVQGAQRITKDGFRQLVNQEIEAPKTSAIVAKLNALKARLDSDDGYFEKIKKDFVDSFPDSARGRWNLHQELPDGDESVDKFCAERLLLHILDRTAEGIPDQHA